MNLYETAALFNQNMNPDKQQKFRELYTSLFSPYQVHSIHDCSIGAGGSTLPLASLGYRVSGSDLSQNLLDQAGRNFAAAGFNVRLFVSDFRSLAQTLTGPVDCLISTGNSLPHVNNQDAERFVRTATGLVNPGGLLFIDLRNWDKVLAERPVFSARDPLVMTADKHVSLYQIWNWHDDDSVDFIFATCTDLAGKHQKTAFTQAPRYYPLRYRDYLSMLGRHGFEPVRAVDLDDLWLGQADGTAKSGRFEEDFMQIGWYGVLARKI